MVSCEPYQTYKIPLKNNGQSVIEHNLVTIYLNLEWPENINDNPNLLIQIFDKKASPKPCKSEASMSYFQQNQSSLLVNSIHHHHHQQQQNLGSTYQQQYYHHSSVINNEPPTTTTTITTGDHNDVSSTTTTVVFSALQPPPPSSQTPIQQIKNEVKTQLSPIYQRQQTSNSPPICSSTNQQYLSSQHVIQTPPSNLDIQSNIQISPTLKTISPTSSTNIPTKQTLTHVIDLQQSSPISSYPPSTSSSSTFKAFVCTCLKPQNVHEHNCPALTLAKQQSNAPLTSQTIVCRPPINRSIAQRAAVASQNRTNRSITIIPVKEQGQTSSSTTLFPFSISNAKPPNITTIVSQQQSNFPTIKKAITRQRSVNSINSRQRKKRIIKQISLPNETNQNQSSFYNQTNLNDSKQQTSTFMIKEEHITSPNPTIKLVSPFSIQTTVTNSEIDQTIDDVINGKGDISINDSSQLQTKSQIQQPSSQLVWVQNGTVTTKTWLSPLYQKQQQQQQQQHQQQHQQHQQQPVYDSIGSTLTHQDVVNIAQQVVFPTNTEHNQINTVLPPSTTNNSKKKARSKSINTTPLKRNRNRKPPPNRLQLKSTTSSQQEHIGKTPIPSPITPIHNLINKPITWSNIPTPSSSSSSSGGGGGSATRPITNIPLLNSNQHLSSFDKNDSWQSQCVENVDSMLDEFHLVSIDEQRINSNHHFDFDLSIDNFSSKTNDRFGSLTPPPPLTIDNQYTLLSTDKLLNSSITNSRLLNGDIDVYDHFLNPYSSSIWQENQVTSSVSTPPDFQINNFPIQHQQGQQQYYSSQTNNEHFDSYNNPQSQVRLLFDVQS